MTESRLQAAAWCGNVSAYRWHSNGYDDRCSRCARIYTAIQALLKEEQAERYGGTVVEDFNVVRECRVNRRPSDDAFRFYTGGTIELMRLSRADALRVATDILELAEVHATQDAEQRAEHAEAQLAAAIDDRESIAEMLDTQEQVTIKLMAQLAEMRAALEQWIAASLDRSFPWWAAELRALLTAPPQEPAIP